MTELLKQLDDSWQSLIPYIFNIQILFPASLDT